MVLQRLCFLAREPTLAIGDKLLRAWMRALPIGFISHRPSAMDLMTWVDNSGSSCL